jgi:hypothetical protein
MSIVFRKFIQIFLVYPEEACGIECGSGSYGEPVFGNLNFADWPLNFQIS